MPIPRAASTASGSTPSMATTVFVTMGGIASSASATTVGPNPNASFGCTRRNAMKASTRTAKEGTERPRFATVTAATLPRRVCPTMTPTGSPIRSAMAMAASESWRCSNARAGMPFSPDQCAAAVSQWITFTRPPRSLRSRGARTHGTTA